MEKRKDINILDFSTIFQALGANLRTGTLRVTSPRRETMIYLYEGQVAGVYSLAHKLRIGEALLKSGKIKKKQLDKALAKQGRYKKNLGRVCIKMKFITEEDLFEALVFQVTEEICDVFTWESIHCEFSEGPPPKELDVHHEAKIRLNLPVDMLVMEAARRTDEWRLLSQSISLLDVYIMTPTAAHYFREANTEGEREILQILDGKRDVEEIAEAAYRGKFEAIKILHSLALKKEIAPLTAKDLVRLGNEEAEKDNSQKAIRLYERALELGVDEFDLSYKLAKMHEAQGNIDEAVQRYLSYGKRCESAGRLKEAVEAYRAVLGLESERLDMHERLIEILMRLRLADDVINESMKLAEKWVARANHEDAINLWRRVVDFAPESTIALRRLADLYRAADDPVQAIIELESLASILLARKKTKEAIDVYREMLGLDRECVQARVGLAETLASTGATEEAVREYNALAENLSASGVIRDTTNWEFLINIYEKIINLTPDNLLARRWLATAYQEKDNREKALSHLRGIVETLISRELFSEAIPPLRKIIELDAGDVEGRLRLAELYLRERDTERALVEYHRLAKHAMSQGDFALAKRALTRSLEINPFDLTALREFAEIAAREDDVVSQVERLTAIARMAAAAGMYPEARAAYADILSVDPENLAALSELAEIHIQRGNIREAIDLLVQSASKHLEMQNLGLAIETAQRVLALQPGHVRARSLLTEARRRSGHVILPDGKSQQPTLTTAQAEPSTPQPVIVTPGEKPGTPGGEKSDVLGSIQKLQKMKLGSEVSGVRSSISKSSQNLGDISDAVRGVAASGGKRPPASDSMIDIIPDSPDEGGEDDAPPADDPLDALEAMGDVPSWKDAEGNAGPTIELPDGNEEEE
ncbi:MAG: tetratricopeptide repeat protein [Planctomycetota bacterium]|nr:MAG: tetratricopeptide repeat protein [Planctomycetota bacterium]